MKILLVGGGSGGHLYPLFCIADFLEENNIYSSNDIHFIIAKNNADFEYFSGKTYSYTEFPVAKLRRYFSLENIRDFGRFFYNIYKSYNFLKKHKPEKIFSKGGFVSLPFGISAKFLKIPFYLHESDSVMGLSNRILERFSKKIFTGFPSNNSNHIFVGNPIRSEFFRPTEKKDHKIPHILVFGGSQGANALNEWARTFAKKYTGKQEILVVTGKGKKSQEKIPNLTEVEFLHKEFIDAVNDADIVISRAGGSIGELAAAKKCVILVPLPSAANDHQCKNAEIVAQKNAGIVIEEKNLYSSESEDIIKTVLKNEEKRKEIASQLFLHFAKNDVVKKIVKELELQ